MARSAELAATGADASVFLIIAIGAGLALLGGAAVLIVRKRNAAAREEDAGLPGEEPGR